MSGESDQQNPERAPEEYNNETRKSEQRSDRDPFQHDPIIIDGGSFTFEFDGETQQHYYSLVSGRYVGGNLGIEYVKVKDKDRPSREPPHECPLPASGIFTIEVRGEIAGHPETNEPFTVRVVPGVVAVDFDTTVYGRPTSRGRRKRAGHPHRMVSGLTITALGFKHTCPAIPEHGRCKITIRDNHLIGTASRWSDLSGEAEGGEEEAAR